MKNNRGVLKISLGIAVCFLLIVFVFIGHKIELQNTNIVIFAEATKEKKYMYLSDISYIKDQSSVGWGTITYDKNLDAKYNNGFITLNVEGKAKSFLKGISAHATSSVVFDISAYDFDYFSTYYGVDVSRGKNGNGVKFAIETSVDGTNWEVHTLVSPPIKKGNDEAEFITIDVRNKKYLRLRCNDLGNKDSDHCEYGNAKLYKEGYIEDNTPYSFIKPLEEYDKVLTKSSNEALLSTNEMTLLQRKFVSNFGYEMLQNYAHLDEDRKETLEWILTDKDALRYYITGGAPTGTYMNSLETLVRLYTEYKKDLKNTTKTDYTILGDLYKRMMISLSLTHSANVCLWIGGSQCSDAVVRYGIYKKMLAEGLLLNKVFETLNIEEMRWVMNNNIDDEEIEWLNHHIRRSPSKWGPYNTDPYHYITYRFGYNYSLSQYYDEANYTKWDEKYHLSKYNITYQTGKPKLWIVFEQGSVCGGLSKTGSNINGSLGNPSAVIGQPGHAAYLEYSETTDGKGMWTIKNNVSGWTQSEKSERLLCGWGSNSWDSYYQVSYVPYAQEALNDIENYNKALETMLMVDLYPNDVSQKERIYEEALKYQNINMNAWYGLIRTYQQNEKKTAEDYIQLAKRLSEALYAFPLPMFDLMNLLKGNLENTNYYATYTNLIRVALEKGTTLHTENSSILQPAITRTMANYLLGKNDYSIANFSFDGENAGKIMLGSKYEGNGVRWEYSLDQGKSWKATSESFVQLQDKEIEFITAENDIKIHIVGVDYSPTNIYTIDITKAEISNMLFNNDLENKVIGVDDTYEWRRNEKDSWHSYRISSPNLTGNQTVDIRVGATKTSLPSDYVTYRFTEDNQPDTRKYIPVSYLSISSVSTEATAHAGQASNAIDGNYNTRWHSAWNGTDTERFIVVELLRPVYLSAVEFVPAGGGNGKIYDGSIYGSVDGENWELLTQAKNLRYTNQANTIEDAIANTKSFELEESKNVKYVKIVADRTNGNWITAREFNFYQDVTKNPIPTAGIKYSENKKTNKDVIVQLVNPSAEIEILNNSGNDTYTFIENGEFTFEFIDTKTGAWGSATAKVDWIDKEAPTATLNFSTNHKTNEDVLVTLVPSEPVTMLNNTCEAESCNPFTYTFLENGEFTFEFMDEAGNIGTMTAKVDFIDRVIPTGFVTYNITDKTNKDVTAIVTLEKEDARIVNNGGVNAYKFTENGEFTFEIIDEAGNMNRITASVGWIDKVAPNASIKYSITTTTKDNVVAQIVSDEKIIITNNGGEDTYTFTENGTFTFTYRDDIGNKGKVTARVNWIQKDTNTTPLNPNGNNTSANKPNSDNNSTTSKPSNGNNTQVSSGNDNSSNSSQESETKEENNNTIKNEEEKKEETSVTKKEFRTFTFHNISVAIPKEELEEKVTLRHKNLVLTAYLSKRFEESSEYFELYLENVNKEKININSTVKMTIDLNKDKNFLGIYVVKGYSKIEALQYDCISEDKIEVETTNLGRYLIAYEEKKEQASTDNSKYEIIKKNKMWVTLSMMLLAAIIAIYLVARRKE